MIDGVWPAWNGTRLICGGCGRTAPPLERAEAVTLLEDLTDRYLRRAAEARAVADPAVEGLLIVAGAQIAHRWSGLDAYLGDRVPLDSPLEGPLPGQTEAALVDAAARLAWTITTVADHRWRDRSAAGLVPAELAWTVLHDALHAVEDIELGLTPLGRAQRAPTTSRATALVDSSS